MTQTEWKDAYASLRPTYEIYEKKLRDLVITVLEQAKIDVVQVEGRVKTLESFAEKIERKSGKYADPLSDMTDLVGLRIIAYYVEDIDRIARLLRDEFEVLEDQSTDKQAELAPDQFGYTSNHLVVRIGNRSSFPEWRQFSAIAVEFQVRTTLQHAWAAVSHKLNYKRVEEVPVSLQRRLFRLSALFEIADEQFSAIKTAISELSDQYSENVKLGQLEIEIDANSIEAYILTSPKVRVAIDVANPEVPVRPLDPDSPSTTRYRSNLIRVANYLGARTIEDFDLLVPDKPTTKRLVRAIKEAYLADKRNDPPSFGPPHRFLATLLMTAHGVSKELYESVYSTGWPEFLEARKLAEGQT